jgi:hypothetical protein
MNKMHEGQTELRPVSSTERRRIEVYEIFLLLFVFKGKL